MPLLLNNTTKQVENIDDTSVAQAIASGQYSPRMGTRLNVITPTGDTGTIDASEAQLQFQQGWQYLTREQQKQITDEKVKGIWKEELDMPGAAATLGAARGLTFGLSDVAIRGVSELAGSDAAQLVGKVREENPLASTIGEVGGAVAGALAPGALIGAGVKGATKLGTLAAEKTVGRLATKAVVPGSMAGAGEATIGRLAAKYGANSVIVKAAQAAAGTAVEGALYGAGEVLTEAALEDPKLSASHAIATIGLGSALGGAFGGFTKVGSEAYHGFQNLLKESTIPSVAADKLGKLYSKVTSLSRGLAPDDAARMEQLISTREGRDLIFKATQDRSVNENTMVNALAEVQKAGDGFKSMWGSAREAARADLSSKGVGPLRYVIRKDLNKSIDSAINKISKESEFYMADTIPALRQIQQNMTEGLKNVTNRADLHELIERNRQLIDSKMKFSYFERSGTASKTEKVLADVRGTFNDILTDTGKFGKFADDYAQLNAAYNSYKAVEKNLLKEFSEKTTDEFGKTVLQISPAKVAAFYRSPEKMTNANKLLTLDKLEESMKKLKYAANATGKNNPELAQKLLEEAQTGNRIFKDITDARTAEMFLNNLETRTGKSTIGTLIGGAIGSLGGMPGAVAGGLIGSAVATPRSFLNILYSIENHGIAGQQRVQNAVSKFYGNGLFSTTIKRVSPIVKPITIKSAIEILGGEGDSVEDLKGTINEHYNEPQKLWKTLNENNPHLEDVAPIYSMEMYNTMNRGIQFLQQKMPANYTQDMFGAKPSPISDSQHRTLNAYVDAIFRPSKIYDELEKGRPDPRVVETIQAVYPDLYANLQKEVMKQAVDSKIGYQKKLTLGRLFAVPTTASLERINDFQKSYEAPPVPQQIASNVKFKSITQHQTISDTLQQ